MATDADAAVRIDLLDVLDTAHAVAPLDPRRRVFVNRNLNLAGVKFVGFDMDYTLAIYKKGAIEELAFRLTVENLIASRGYPPEIRQIRYEPERVIRGLVVDKHRGNIFKMDRYGHVGRAWHGSRQLGREERRELYRTRKIELHSGGYAWVDTLFSLPEVCLYSLLVDWFDARAPERRPSYEQLYDDTRAAIDEVHADGSLKSVIQAEPAAYIERDPDLARTLHRLRSSGKRLFLLTNSYWPYTCAVMRYLLDGALEGYPSWRTYFDLVVVGARKPEFFASRSPFLPIDERTGRPGAEPAATLDKGRVYQGGNLRDLEQLAGLGGEHVLYVGDHIYGDMLKSKKSSLWRTAMIVPELEDVLWHQQLFDADHARAERIEDELRRLDYEINYYKLLLAEAARRREQRAASGESSGYGGDTPTAQAARAERAARCALEQLRAQARRLRVEKEEIEQRVDSAANPYWGRLFREGVETSLFAKQLEEYACIYTSRVSNLIHYSPVQYFRSPPVPMPHELGR
ncbi:MAG: haloacid dehalogenase [Planctomycetota bacterium]|nr:MAG: haloacid dehalogenase [Planctomycetota bacterium]